MPKRSSKKKKKTKKIKKAEEAQDEDVDVNELAARIVESATKKSEEAENNTSGKNPAAVALGRLGGLKGGKARADKLTAEQRSEIARKAARARWESRE